MRRFWLGALAIHGRLRAQAPGHLGLEQLNATLWMQTSPEYRAGTEQVYRLATERVANPAPGTRRSGADRTCRPTSWHVCPPP